MHSYCGILIVALCAFLQFSSATRVRRDDVESEVQQVLALYLFSPLNAICPLYGLLVGSSETNNPEIEDVWRRAGLMDPRWTTHPEFATSCGFTLNEIRAMCTILGTDPATFTDEVCKNLQSYQAYSDAEPVWSCKDVFGRFMDKLGQWPRLNPRPVIKFF